jgi:hypothetical protein
LIISAVWYLIWPGLAFHLVLSKRRTLMSSADPPIVITGGSVTITIPSGLFSSLLGGNFTNTDKEIKRVEITGTGIANYSESATGKDITIRIEYGNP